MHNGLVMKDMLWEPVLQKTHHAPAAGHRVAQREVYRGEKRLIKNKAGAVDSNMTLEVKLF